MNFRTLRDIFLFDPNAHRIATKGKHYFNYVTENNKGERVVREAPKGNFILYTISQYAKKYNFEGIKLYGHYSLSGEHELKGDDRFLNIPQVYIHTSISMLYDVPILSFEVSLGNVKKRFDIPIISNLEVTEDNIKKLVFRYINAHLLYKNGMHRFTQLYLNLSKEQLKSLYKRRLSADKNINSFDVEDYIYSKFNITFNSYYIDYNKVVKFAKNLKNRPKETIEIRSYRDLFLSLDNFDGDIEELEAIIYEETRELIYM